MLNEQVVPKIKSITNTSNVKLIDLNSVFADRSVLLPEGVYPNAEGAELLARTVYESLQNKLTSELSHE